MPNTSQPTGELHVVAVSVVVRTANPDDPLAVLRGRMRPIAFGARYAHRALYSTAGAVGDLLRAVDLSGCGAGVRVGRLCGCHPLRAFWKRSLTGRWIPCSPIWVMRC